MVMRVVLDANVYVSALIAPHGTAADVFQAWEEEQFAVLTSEPILQELDRVLHYPKLRERYNLPEDRIRRFLELL